MILACARLVDIEKEVQMRVKTKADPFPEVNNLKVFIFYHNKYEKRDHYLPVKFNFRYSNTY